MSGTFLTGSSSCTKGVVQECSDAWSHDGGPKQTGDHRCAFLMILVVMILLTSMMVGNGQQALPQL